MTENPYKSPEVDGYPDSRPRRPPSPMSWPLLLFMGIFFAIATLAESAASVVPQVEFTRNMIVLATGIASLTCFALAIRAFSRRQPPDSGNEETNEGS